MGGHQLFTCQSKQKKILITLYRCSGATVLLMQPQAILKEIISQVSCLQISCSVFVRSACLVLEKGLTLRPGGGLSLVCLSVMPTTTYSARLKSVWYGFEAFSPGHQVPIGTFLVPTCTIMLMPICKYSDWPGDQCHWWVTTAAQFRKLETWHF